MEVEECLQEEAEELMFRGVVEQRYQAAEGRNSLEEAVEGESGVVLQVPVEDQEVEARRYLL